jgi:hypothetical protein
LGGLPSRGGAYFVLNWGKGGSVLVSFSPPLSGGVLDRLQELGPEVMNRFTCLLAELSEELRANCGASSLESSGVEILIFTLESWIFGQL